MFNPANSRGKPSLSVSWLVFGIVAIFGLILPNFASASTWQITNSGSSIADAISQCSGGVQLSGGLYNFGWSIASEDNIIVVGDPASNNEAGAVYILEKNSDNFTCLNKLVSPTPQPRVSAEDISGARFGFSVGISGDTIVVGAVFDNIDITVDGFANVEAGSVYVFTRPSDGWSGVLTEPARLIAPDAHENMYFGQSVDIDGNNIIVGAMFGYSVSSTAYGSSGSAYIYTRPTDGWVSTSSSIATWYGLVGPAYFGYSVAIAGDVAVIGAIDSDNNPSNRAYIYTKTGADWSGYSEPTILSPSNQFSGDLFGYSVAVSDSGDTVVVGASNDKVAAAGPGGWGAGAAYVFSRPSGGWTGGDLTESAVLIASDAATTTEGSSHFGESIAFNGDYVAIGAPWNIGGADSRRKTGAVYLYSEPDSGWSGMLTEDFKILGVDSGDNHQYYGQDVTFIGDEIFSISPMSQNRDVGFSLVSLAELNGSVDTTAPDAPSNVRADAGTVATSSLTIVWDAVADAVVYTVSSSLGVVTITDATVSFSGLTPNTQYDFVVSAADAAGNTSTYSAVFTVYTAANVPAISAAVDSQTQITVSWTGDASEYFVSRESGNDSGWTTSTSFVFTGLSCGNSYNFSVKGRNGSAVETAVASVSAATSACDAPPSGGGGYTPPVIPPVVIPTTTVSSTLDTATSTVITSTTQDDNIDSSGPDENDQGENSDNSGNDNSASGSPARANTGGRPAVVLVGNNISASSGNSDNKPLEIKLPTTSDNGGIVPAAQAGEGGAVLGTKVRGYFSRVFNSENNWVILLSALIALAAIVGGWLVWKWKKGDKDEANKN